MQRTIKSLFKHRNKIIVVADGAFPTGEAKEIAEKAGAEFRVFEREDSATLNPSAMFNIAKEIDVDAFLFLHDDVFLKEASHATEMISAAMSDGFAFGKVIAYDGRGDRDFAFENNRQDDKVKAGHMISVAKKTFDECGGFPDSFRRNIGYEFEALEILMANIGIYPKYCERCIGFHQWHKKVDNISFQKRSNLRHLKKLPKDPQHPKAFTKDAQKNVDLEKAEESKKL